MKEPPGPVISKTSRTCGFHERTDKNQWIYGQFFFPAFLKTVVIYQNWVFNFLELSLRILRTALITTGGLFTFLITAQHCNYHDVLFVEGTLGGVCFTCAVLLRWRRFVVFCCRSIWTKLKKIQKSRRDRFSLAGNPLIFCIH